MKKNICSEKTQIKAIILFILFGVILSLLLLLNPTDDDWRYLTAPNLNFNVRTLLPNGNFWRPFDAIFGYFLSLHPKWFPVLNHLWILIGHFISTFIIYLILLRIEVSKYSRNISICFYFVSPAILGTLLGIDSLNQVYASTWGLLSLYAFITIKCKYRYLFWILFAFMSTFSKENGLAYFLIPPIFNYAISTDLSAIKKKKCIVEMALGILSISIYLILRFTLKIGDMSMNETTPYVFTFKNKLLDALSFIGSTFTAIDSISLIHKASRNLIIVFMTTIFSLPFIYFVFLKQIRYFKKAKAILFILCLLIAVAPHLLTHFGPMHAYSGLGMFVIIVSIFVDKTSVDKKIELSFILYFSSALFVDAHHWYKTYMSSQVGIEMAKYAIMHTKDPVDSIFVLSISDNSQKYSSFCVRPFDAYHYGDAALYLNNYYWPRKCHVLVLRQNDMYKVNGIVDSVKVYTRYKYIWINYKNKVKVICLRK